MGEAQKSGWRWWATATALTSTLAGAIAGLSLLIPQVEGIATFLRKHFTSEPTQITLSELWATNPFEVDAPPPKFNVTIHFRYIMTGAGEHNCLGELRVNNTVWDAIWGFEGPLGGATDKYAKLRASSVERDGAFEFEPSMESYSKKAFFRVRCPFLRDTKWEAVDIPDLRK